MIVNAYLIVRADGSTRTVSRAPRLGMDEFAFRLRVKVPDTWGKIAGDIEVVIPDTVVPEVTIDIAEDVNDGRGDRTHDGEPPDGEADGRVHDGKARRSRR